MTIDYTRDPRDEYAARQARSEHPQGSFDKAGRWYPDDEERASCCDQVRSPSRAHPYTYMLHCRTLKHITTRNTDHTESTYDRYSAMVSRLNLRSQARREADTHE